MAPKRTNEPPRVFKRSAGYLELHPDGNAKWYLMPCREQIEAVGNGTWVAWDDGAVTLNPDLSPPDLESWNKLVGSGRTHVELQPDGAGYRFEESQRYIQEWTPPAEPPRPCLGVPPAPRRPYDPMRDSPFFPPRF